MKGKEGAAERPNGARDAWGAVVLAAGRSRRMGRLKAFLGWEGAPLIVHQVAELHRAGAVAIAVVTGFRAARLERCLQARGPAGVRCVLNPSADHGRASSLRIGIAALPPSLGAYLVAAVDQPLVAAVVDALLAERAADPAAAAWLPAYRGRAGHPVLCAGRLREELLRADDAEQGLRGILRRHAAKIRLVETGDPRVRCDLNTPADYARWAAAAGGDHQRASG